LVFENQQEVWRITVIISNAKAIIESKGLKEKGFSADAADENKFLRDFFKKCKESN
jgi:hypothetical protein